MKPTKENCTTRHWGSKCILGADNAANKDQNVSKHRAGMVTHVCNPSPLEAKAGE